MPISLRSLPPASHDSFPDKALIWSAPSYAPFLMEFASWYVPWTAARLSLGRLQKATAGPYHSTRPTFISLLRKGRISQVNNKCTFTGPSPLRPPSGFPSVWISLPRYNRSFFLSPGRQRLDAMCWFTSVSLATRIRNPWSLRGNLGPFQTQIFEKVTFGVVSWRRRKRLHRYNTRKVVEHFPRQKTRLHFNRAYPLEGICTSGETEFWHEITLRLKIPHKAFSP